MAQKLPSSKKYLMRGKIGFFIFGAILVFGLVWRIWGDDISDMFSKPRVYIGAVSSPDQSRLTDGSERQDESPSGDELVSIALDAYGAGNYKKAIRYFDMAIQEGAESYGADLLYMFIGEMQIMLELYDEAILSLKESLSLNPESYECLVDLGMVYTNIGDDLLAITYYEKAIGIDDSDEYAHAYLSLAYERVGQLDDAEKSAERARELGYANYDYLESIIESLRAEAYGRFDYSTYSGVWYLSGDSSGELDIAINGNTADGTFMCESARYRIAGLNFYGLN